MSVGSTTLKLGWTNPQTGQFGAHPLLGAVVDLNDAATYTLLSPDGLELSPPERSVVPAGNVRTQGERAARAIYRHNRHARIGLVVGPMSDYASLSATVRTLLRWLSAPPQVPFCVQWQPPSASAPVYLDVVACGHDIPTDEGQWLRMQLEPVAIELWVRPGLRGDLVRLSNLVFNPGFEAPMGGVGTAALAPVAFADGFANVNAYGVIAGGAPSLNPAQTYVDVVQAPANGGASLLRYYRLGETGGTAPQDIAGTAQTGTLHNNPTQGVAGSLTGDTDTAYGLAAASSQFITLPGAGLPSGNGVVSLACLFKIGANPGANATLLSVGTAGVAHTSLNLYVNTSGKLCADGGAGTTVLSSAVVVTDGQWHLGVASWDGTTMALTLDNAAAVTAAPGAQTIPASPYATIGGITANGTGWTNFWNGAVDEVCLWGAALTAAQISALYTAFKTGAAGTVANALSVPSGAMLSFGSPAWGPVSAWQLRVRWSSVATEFDCFLHRVDANNALYVAVKGTQLLVVQLVAGVLHQVGQATIALSHEGWYWLQVSQFPAAPGDSPYVSATLFADQVGAVGVQLGQAAGGCYDAVTALVGGAAIAAVGAQMVIGGTPNGSGSCQQVSLFGPGGWWVANTGASLGSGAWEQASANTAPVGTRNQAGASGPAGGVMVPVQSLAAARIDAPPAGAVGWSTAWQSGSTASLAALQQSAMPVAAGGDALFFSGLLRASGNGAGYSAWAQVREYSAAGALLKTSGQQVLASGAGAVAWQAWNWNYGATQAGTAYVILSLGASDATSSSAGSATWFDNVQAWDVAATGVAASAGAMPYCELRAPQSPAQLLVTGLLGDLPAPAALNFGAYLASWPLGSLLNFALGRAAQASASARLVGSSFGYFGAGGNPLASAGLDASGYGGFYATVQMNPSWSPRPFSLSPADAPGVYHFFQRFWSGQNTANIANVQARANVLQRTHAWYGDLNYDDELWDGYGPWVSLLSAGSTWTVCDAGQVRLPPQALGALSDPTQNFLTPHAQWVDNTGGGGSAGRASWAALLPVDGSLLVGVLNNPSNALVGVNQQWVWAYFDGLLTNRAGAQDGPAWGYSLEASAEPNAAHAGGGPGTQTTGSINVNSGADPYLVLDPSVTVAQTGQQGVNQLVGYLADGNAAVLPFAAEIAYYPLYLWPR